MKKFLLILLSLAVCIAMCACGNTQKDIDEKFDGVQESGVADPKEESKSKLSDAYDAIADGPGASDYATLAYDKMSLVIDTNPNDGYFKYESNATAAVMAVNLYLELPSSISEKMSSTRALDGMQSQNCGSFTVSWTYHPDNGLRVIYEVNP